jgi:hypothetical protein
VESNGSSKETRRKEGSTKETRRKEGSTKEKITFLDYITFFLNRLSRKCRYWV